MWGTHGSKWILLMRGLMWADKCAYDDLIAIECDAGKKRGAIKQLHDIKGIASNYHHHERARWGAVRLDCNKRSNNLKKSFFPAWRNPSGSYFAGGKKMWLLTQLRWNTNVYSAVVAVCMQLPNNAMLTKMPQCCHAVRTLQTPENENGNLLKLPLTNEKISDTKLQSHQLQSKQKPDL